MSRQVNWRRLTVTVVTIFCLASALSAQGSDAVRFAQERLAALGYAPGQADGTIGAKTATALKQFQRDHGLPATGQLDPKTGESLAAAQLKSGSPAKALTKSAKDASDRSLENPATSQSAIDASRQPAKAERSLEERINSSVKDYPDVTAFLSIVGVVPLSTPSRDSVIGHVSRLGIFQEFPLPPTALDDRDRLMIVGRSSSGYFVADAERLQGGVERGSLPRELDDSSAQALDLNVPNPSIVIADPAYLHDSRFRVTYKRLQDQARRGAFGVVPARNVVITATAKDPKTYSRDGVYDEVQSLLDLMESHERAARQSVLFESDAGGGRAGSVTTSLSSVEAISNAIGPESAARLALGVTSEASLAALAVGGASPIVAETPGLKHKLLFDNMQAWRTGDRQWLFRLFAVSRISDPDLLTEVALNADAIVVRLAAVRQITDPVLLRKIATDSDNPFVRSEAATRTDGSPSLKLTGQVGTASESLCPRCTFESLQSLLDSKKGQDRTDAARFATELSDHRAVDLLIRALRDKDDSVRAAAARSLARRQDTATAVDPLLATLAGDRSDERRDFYIQALGTIGSPKATEALLRDLQLRKVPRRATIQALGTIGDEQAVTALLALLSWTLPRQAKAKDYPPKIVDDTRIAAASALSGIRTPRAVDPLTVGLAASTGRVRCSFLRALAHVGGDTHVIQVVVTSVVDLAPDCHPDAVVGDAFDLLVRSGGNRSLLAPALRKGIAWQHAADWLSGRAKVFGTLGRNDEGAAAALLADWERGPILAAALRSSGWRPVDPLDQTRFDVALRSKSELIAKWQQTRALLLDDVRSTNPFAMKNALYALISLGQNDVLPDLVSFLTAGGSVSLAEAYLNCGSRELAAAAEAWAQQHHYRIMRGSGAHPVSWGVWK